VAVHRLLGEQREDRGADIPAPRPRPTAEESREAALAAEQVIPPPAAVAARAVPARAAAGKEPTRAVLTGAAGPFGHEHEELLFFVSLVWLRHRWKYS